VGVLSQLPDVLTVPWALSVRPGKIARIETYTLKLPELGDASAQEATARLIVPSLKLGQWYGIRAADIVRIAQHESDARNPDIKSLVYQHGIDWLEPSLEQVAAAGFAEKLQDLVVAYAPTQALIDILPRKRPRNPRWTQ
jgi:hypothetical protein